MGRLVLKSKHRLICGDSTSDEVFERLMNGAKADVVFTSPPYADQREYHIGEFDWLKLMNGVSDVLFRHVTDDAHILVNLGMSCKDHKVNSYYNPWLEHCEKVGWPLFELCIWDKGHGLPGEYHGRLAPSFELVFHFNNVTRKANKWVKSKDPVDSQRQGSKRSFREKDGKTRPSNSPDSFGQEFKIPDNVIRIPRKTVETETGDHPAIFPVELPEFGFRTWGMSVAIEPFAGSGTSIVAGEKCGISVYACELEPSYCDIILSRYTKFSGLKAIREDGTIWES